MKGGKWWGWRPGPAPLWLPPSRTMQKQVNINYRKVPLSKRVTPEKLTIKWIFCYLSYIFPINFHYKIMDRVSWKISVDNDNVDTPKQLEVRMALQMRQGHFPLNQFTLAQLHMAQWFSNFNVDKNELGILLNEDSDSRVLGQGLRFCISSKFSGDADVISLRTSFWVMQF